MKKYHKTDDLYGSVDKVFISKDGKDLALLLERMNQWCLDE